jgi:hypothetical protein
MSIGGAGVTAARRCRRQPQQVWHLDRRRRPPAQWCPGKLGGRPGREQRLPEETTADENGRTGRLPGEETHRQAMGGKEQRDGAVCAAPLKSVVETERSLTFPPSSSSYAYEESSGSAGSPGIEVILSVKAGVSLTME